MSTGAVDVRLPAFSRFGVAFTWGLRRAFRSRRFVVTALVAAVAGAGLGALMAYQEDRVHSLWQFLHEQLLATAVPLVALALAGTGFADEVQDQTLVFHLVRPISRPTLFVARYASGLCAALVVAVAMTVAAVVASRTGLPAAVHVEVAATAALGTATVGAVYYALGALFRRGLVAGLVYTFLMEGVFQHLPGSIQKLSLMHHVRSVFHRMADADFAVRSKAVAAELDPKPLALDLRNPQNMVLQAAEREDWTSVAGALLVCGITVVVCLAVGARAVARKDFALKE
jgi:hypothetical protein